MVQMYQNYNYIKTMTDSYFQGLSQALTHSQVHTPTFIIDKQRLDYNIEQLMNSISQGYSYRIVAKSLPSIPFVQYLMRKTGSNRLMSFHLPFLMQLVEEIPSADILMGKPMPVEAARLFYRWFKENSDNLYFAPDVQLQWLIDTPERLAQYSALAQELEISLRINIEIDVGLHRGGFKADEQFANALKLIDISKHLSFAGVMGYEAHISRLPNFLGGSKLALNATRKRYNQFVNIIKNVFGEQALETLCLNTGGSSTYALHEHDTIVANEIATASALIKPTDFDVFSLQHHLPAGFIAAPVLKRVHNPEIPEAPFLSGLLRTLGKLPKEGCFIYGGNWLAEPCFPEEAKRSHVFGHSSNQEFYQLPRKNSLKVDDYMFFRPMQSEFVLLQFGELAIYDDGEITDWWSVFDYPTSYKQLFKNNKKPEFYLCK